MGNRAKTERNTARTEQNGGWLYYPEFPEHWTRRPLYSLAEWVNGLAFRNIQFSPTGKPVIKIAEIKGGISGQTEFTEQVFAESVHVRARELLFSWSGQPETSIDAFWWRGPDGWLNQHVFRVTPCKGIDRTFFYYLLRYLRPNFIGIARNKQTTGLGHVTKRDLESIQAAFPSLDEQQAIAHILGTLDDKIELNRRMNETLEAMARAIFKSWFIDFDPVRRNIARRTGRNQPSPEAPLPKGEGFKPTPPGPLPRGEGAHYRGGYDFAGLLETARELRRKQTPAEEILWELLRDRRLHGLKFRRQHQIGDYIVDFYCHEHCLVVELDGPIHSEAQVQKKDSKRDAYLRSLGLTVLRFRNEQLLEYPESVLQEMAARLSPLPVGEGLGEGGVDLIDALFPDSFQDSPLGKIPQGWAVATLDAFAVLNPEMWTKETAPHQIRYVDLSNVKWGRIESTTEYAWREAPSRAQRILHSGDTIVGTVRPANGSYALISEEGLTGSTGFAVLRPRKREFREVVYLGATAPDNIERLSHLADGAAYPAVRPDVVASTQFVRSPDAVLNCFSSAVRALVDKVAANGRESRTLAAIRDSLLPKLISGEIRARDTERLVGVKF